MASSLCCKNPIFVIPHEELLSGDRIQLSTTRSLPLKLLGSPNAKIRAVQMSLFPGISPSLWSFVFLSQEVQQLWSLASQNLCPVKNQGLNLDVLDLFLGNTSFKSSCFCSKALISKAINLVIRKGMFRDKQPQTSCSWNGSLIYHPCLWLYWLCIITQGNYVAEIIQVQLSEFAVLCFSNHASVCVTKSMMAFFSHFLLLAKLPYGQWASRYFKRVSKKNRLKENRESRPMILERIVCNSICIKTKKGSEQSNKMIKP